MVFLLRELRVPSGASEFHVLVRDNAVEEQQEQYSEQESRRSRNKSEPPPAPRTAPSRE